MKRIFFLQEVAEDGSDVNMGLDISEKESVHARSMLGASEHARSMLRALAVDEVALCGVFLNLPSMLV